MSGELIVCWDLADTLGDYFQPKPGIKEFLQKSSIEGVTHFVVTGAKRDHALEELKRYGISQYLQGILSVEDFDNKDCKPYRRASTLMGISDEEVRHRMIVVGDKPTDRPAESESVVFIQYAQCYKYPVATLEAIFGSLLVQGDNSFYDGFEQLNFQKGNSELTVLGNGITFVQQYICTTIYR